MKPFVHTVFFWLKNPENLSDKNKLEEGLNQLSKINLIKQAFVGKPASTRREVIESSYDFSITFIFDNDKDQEIYQTHPDHLVFIDQCSNLWKKVLVYDAC